MTLLVIARPFFTAPFPPQVLLEAGEDFVKIEELTAEDGEPDILISLDESKIETVGVPAIGRFLCKLQVRLLCWPELKVCPKLEHCWL